MTKINSRLDSALPSPLIEASPASLGFKGLFIWILVGITGGLLVHLAFDIGSQAVLQGIGAGIGIFVGIALKDRAARDDASQPGGYYVLIGCTDAALVVVERSLWTMRDLRVASEVPFEQISSNHIEDRALTPGSIVTFNLADGRSWRYEIQKWANLRGALPQHLRGT